MEQLVKGDYSLIFPERPQNARELLIQYLKSNNRALCAHEIDMLGWWGLIEVSQAVEDGQVKDMDMHPHKLHNAFERYYALPGMETIIVQV
jgi:hypothetical protein